MKKKNIYKCKYLFNILFYEKLIFSYIFLIVTKSLLLLEKRKKGRRAFEDKLLIIFPKIYVESLLIL